MRQFLFHLLLPASLVFLTSCNKKFDMPPLQETTEGAELFIATLKSRVPSAGSHYKIPNSDSSLICTVIADETSGNIFRQVFVRDDAGEALQLNLVSTGGLSSGDRLRVSLQRLYIINSNNMVYVDSVDILKHIVKISSGNAVNITELTLSSLYQQTKAGKPSLLQSQLIRIREIEFVPNTVQRNFADAIAKSTVDQTIRDCNNLKLLIRTSGYANFAAKPLPSGNGYITGILTQYNDRLQLTIRNYNEINMTGALCSVTNPTSNPSRLYLKKDFNDNSLISGGWTSQAVVNNLVTWSVSSFSTTPTPFLKISGFINGSNAASENWLISPATDLSEASEPCLSFQTAAKYPGNLLEVLVSTDYTSGAPQSATWTSLAGFYSLSPAPQTGGYVWTPSGKIKLAGFKTSGTRIAFKYTSTPSGSTTYELDDIVIQE